MKSIILVLIFSLTIFSCQKESSIIYRVKEAKNLVISEQDNDKVKVFDRNMNLVGEIYNINDSTNIFMDYSIDNMLLKYTYVNGELVKFTEKRYVFDEWQTSSSIFFQEGIIDSSDGFWFDYYQDEDFYILEYFGKPIDSLRLVVSINEWYNIFTLDQMFEIEKVYKNMNNFVRVPKNLVTEEFRLTGVIYRSFGDEVWINTFWINQKRFSLNNNRIYNFNAKTMELKELGFDFIK